LLALRPVKGPAEPAERPTRQRLVPVLDDVGEAALLSCASSASREDTVDFVVACRSLCPRFGVAVHPSTPQDSVPAGWALAGKESHLLDE